jgi:dihydrodipicolinate synthase/N-acetylneuraminate lyase
VERVLATVRESAAGDKLLIAGTGAESTAATIEHTNRAAVLGYRVALVRTPHYYRPQMTGEALIGHYFRVADASRIPILIYSVPMFTGISVATQVASRLSEHPNIIGIKDSSGDVSRAAEIINSTPAKFSTLVGSASTLYSSLVVGAAGAILALADVFPQVCVEIFQAARDNDSGHAESLQSLLHEPSQLLSHLGISGIKYAMDRIGLYGGPVRRPLLPLDETQVRAVESAATAVASSAIATPRR